MGKLDFTDTTNNDSQPVKAAINNTIDTYMDSTADYSKYLSGAPNFVTYFSIDVEHTTTDEGLGGVIEQVGNESPVRYNRINNLPVFNVDDVAPTFEYEQDTGMAGSMEGTLVIPPNLIQPQPNDYFMFTYHEHTHSNLRAFRVTNVNFSSITNQTYYQVNYIEDDGIDLTYLDTKQKIGTYEAIYANLGSTKAPIIEESQYKLGVQLERAISSIADVYEDYFYDKDFNLFLAEDEDSKIYSPDLHKFIHDNSVFTFSNSLLKDIIVEPDIDVPLKRYRKTFYYRISNNKLNTPQLTTTYMVNTLVNSGIFSYRGGNFKEVQFIASSPVIEERLDDSSTPVFNALTLKPSELTDFIENTKSRNDLEGLPTQSILLISYLIKNYDIPTDKDIESLISYYDITDLGMIDYLLTPVILFILKSYVNNIYSQKGDDLLHV